MLLKLIAGKKAGKVGTAQIKISFVNIYYVLLGVVGLVSLTFYEVKSSRLGLVEYFICNAFGDPTSSCQLDVNTIKSFKALSISVIVMLSFLPIVVLIFSFDIKAFKKLKVCRGKKEKGSGDSLNTASSRMYSFSYTPRRSSSVTVPDY